MNLLEILINLIALLLACGALAFRHHQFIISIIPSHAAEQSELTAT